VSDPNIDANRQLWNEWTKVHESSAFYDVAGFRAGRTSLRPLELEELGDVRGATVLHLMCHFGLDTLSLARLGARVTGSDFSDAAVALARSLTQELGLQAEFVVGDIYDLPARLQKRFDLVFTSWGVLAWLADLPRWGRLVADYLVPGGRFYMAEIHPFAAALEVEDDGRVVVAYGYFGNGAPERYVTDTSYADRGTVCEYNVSYQWEHSLAEVVTALADAGLVVDFLHEWPFSVYQRWPAMVRDDDGWWYLPDRRDLPLSFSLGASKPREL
jgi:SAM-dependent methyltransferase